MLRIERVLNAEELSRIAETMRGAEFVSGTETAGPLAQRVKNNLQLPKDSGDAKQLADLVRAALHRNPLFFAAALPARLSRLLFSRYDVGMGYGNHVDNTLMPEPEGIVRTDLSATLFLCSPEEYDGGELVIDTGSGAHGVKLPAGDLFLYPSTSIHRVNPVTRGTRQACVFWIQSMVKDAVQRQILLDLDRAGHSLAAKLPDAAELTLLGSAYNNLLRLWAAPG